MKFIEGKIQLKGKWEKFGNRVWINGRELKPDYSQKVWNKSPTGFAWGYLGSGPSQLALAVMLRVLPKHQAIALHQDFKERFIATLPQTDFEIEIDLPAWPSPSSKSGLPRPTTSITGGKTSAPMVCRNTLRAESYGAPREVSPPTSFLTCPPGTVDFEGFWDLSRDTLNNAHAEALSVAHRLRAQSRTKKRGDTFLMKDP